MLLPWTVTAKALSKYLLITKLSKMSVKNSLKFGIGLFLSLFLMVACNEDRDAGKIDNQKLEAYITLEDGGQDVLVKVTHRLDDEQVFLGTFDFEDDNLYHHTDITREEGATKGELIAYAFTSEEKYYQFSDKNNLKLREWSEAAKHLSGYAEKSGAISLAEKTNTISEEYLEYEDVYLRRIGLKKEASARVGVTNVFKNGCITRGGDSNFIVGPKPFFVFGAWRNSISRMFSFSVFGMDIIYDESFYRSRLGSITRTGWQTICFDQARGWSVTNFGKYNDRANSWIKAF